MSSISPATSPVPSKALPAKVAPPNNKAAGADTRAATAVAPAPTSDAPVVIEFSATFSPIHPNAASKPSSSQVSENDLLYFD